MSKEMGKFVKPAGTRPGIMYGNCKVHKQQVDGCPPFRPILSALQTPSYNLAGDKNKYSLLAGDKNHASIFSPSIRYKLVQIDHLNYLLPA